jgi:hypothetical protein
MLVPNELITLSPCHSGNSKTMLVAPEWQDTDSCTPLAVAIH